MFRVGLLIVFLISFPLMIWGGLRSMTTFRNELTQWPAATSPVRQEFDRFQRDFESTDVVLFSWPDCQIHQPQLRQLENQLIDGVHQDWFDCVVSGGSISRTLRDEIDLSARTSVARLTGTLIGPDGLQTCLVVTLSEAGSLHRAQSIEHVHRSIAQTGVAREEIRVAGPASDLNNVDYEGFWSPLRAVPWIGLLAFLLTWLFVRQLELALFISALSSYMGMCALSLVYVSGTPLNALVWTMPTLVLLLTTSAALHFLAYYKDACTSTDAAGAASLALEHAWQPIACCAITTAAGLFSLTLSNLSPIQEFGLFGGISVLVSCLLVLAMLPVWLFYFPYRAHRVEGKVSHRHGWGILAKLCSRFRTPIIAVSLLVVVLLLVRLPELKTGVANADFFSKESRVMQDAAWLEQNLGPRSTVEVVLNFSNANADHDADRFRLLRNLEHEFKSWDSIPGVVSAATYAPASPRKRGGFRAKIEQQIDDARIRKIKVVLKESGYVTGRDKSGSESWRMTVHGSSLSKDRLELLVGRMKTSANRVFESAQDRYFPGEELTVTVAGHAVLLDHVEKQFLQDLAITYATAFGLISLVILLLMRSFAAIAIATLPNMFPAVMVLGGVSILNISLDVGSLLTASVALGIAVDDTLHFLLWWRKKVHSGMSSHDAIVDAMEHCGAAMIQTTVVCGLSVMLYAFCGFLPTIRFGLLLAGMLFVAIIGDLIVLPAILSTRLSQRLIRRKQADD